MFRYADVDGDGKLSFGEFLNIVSPEKCHSNIQENTGTMDLNVEVMEDPLIVQDIEESKTVQFKKETETS